MGRKRPRGAPKVLSFVAAYNDERPDAQLHLVGVVWCQIRLIGSYLGRVKNVEGDFWEKWSAIGQLIGAVGQVVTALIASAIALIAYRYTKQENLIRMRRELNEMANDMDKLIVQSHDLQKFVGSIRNSAVNPAADALAHMYLNYLNTCFWAQKQGMAAASFDVHLHDTAEILKSITLQQITLLLSRGYSPEFKKAIMKIYYNAHDTR